MPDPEAQTATQWRNIEAATGLTLDDFTDMVRIAGVERHGHIVSLLKTRHGTDARQRQPGGTPRP